MSPFKMDSLAAYVDGAILVSLRNDLSYINYSFRGDLRICIQLLQSSSSTPDMITNEPQPLIRLTDRRSTFTIPPRYSMCLGRGCMAGCLSNHNS